MQEKIDPITGEERCACGNVIPKGRGYYKYGLALRCFYCGRKNRRVDDDD